jgi:hypothetical protein
MEDVDDRTAEVIPVVRDREMQLIREAIAMVAAGGALRVVVAGIRFGEVLLEPARRLALESGVRLTPLWTADGARADVAVERITE